MIAASDFPLLVARLAELRDAQATLPELREDLRRVLAAPSPALGDEVATLRERELEVPRAVEALIAGSREHYWDCRPDLRDYARAQFAIVRSEIEDRAARIGRRHVRPRVTAWSVA